MLVEYLHRRKCKIDAKFNFPVTYRVHKANLCCTSSGIGLGCAVFKCCETGAPYSEMTTGLRSGLGGGHNKIFQRVMDGLITSWLESFYYWTTINLEIPPITTVWWYSNKRPLFTSDPLKMFSERKACWK